MVPKQKKDLFRFYSITYSLYKQSQSDQLNNKKPITDQYERPELDDQSALKYLKASKIIFPTILGLSVVIWLMAKQLDFEVVRNFNFNLYTLFWIGMAVLMYIMRHLFYAQRLRIATNYAFSLLKAIQLIVIWEFSTAVTPTSVGGAGVALYLLAKEKLSVAKTISVVLYTMVIDTIFFVLALITLALIIGPVMVRPGMHVFSDIDGYGITFLTVLCFMIGYGIVFFYGLFINPRAIKRLLIIISRFKILKRFRQSLRTTAYDIETAAGEIKFKPFTFHFQAFLCTMGAWTTRFLAINWLIMAFVPEVHRTLTDQVTIFARGIAMHAIEAFSPTPGASGIVEFLFGGFFSDYVPLGIALVIVLLWRLIGYYSYLIAGVIVIPIWFKNLPKTN